MMMDSNKPLFTMEIPYVRIKRKNIFLKQRIHETKTLRFETSFVLTVSKILPLVASLPSELVGTTKHDAAHNLMVMHKITVIDIIAISLQNTNKPVDSKLHDFLESNLTSEQLFEALNYVMICLDLDHLIAGMMLFKPAIAESFQTAKKLHHSTKDSHNATN